MDPIQVVQKRDSYSVNGRKQDVLDFAERFGTASHVSTTLHGDPRGTWSERLLIQNRNAPGDREYQAKLAEALEKSKNTR